MKNAKFEYIVLRSSDHLFIITDEVVTSIDPQKVEILQRYMLETCIEMYMVIIDSPDFILLSNLLFSLPHCFYALMYTNTPNGQGLCVIVCNISL